MKKISKTKIICAAVCVSLAGGLFIPTVSGVAPSYTVGKYYEGSKFYDKLLAVELTGDQRYDIISIARSQLGYHEGNSDADMDGMNSFGNRNFVEYNHIIGAPLDNGEGNGVSYGFEWCAAFVSWCQRQARVPESKVITEVSCIRLSSWLKARGAYKSRSSGYTPIAGDLIFFQTSSSYSPSHVGLVVGTDSTYVYTVEGNNGGRVNYHRYEKSNSSIVGYGTPDYSVKGGAEYDFELLAGYVEKGVYVTTADVNLRQGQGTSTPSFGKIPKGTELEIREAVGNWASVSYGGNRGWVSLDYIKYQRAITYSVVFLDENGDVISQTRYEEGSVIEIPDDPKKESDGSYDYVFLRWSEEIPEIARKDMTFKAVFEAVPIPVEEETEEETGQDTEDNTDESETEREETTENEEQTTAPPITHPSAPKVSDRLSAVAGVLALLSAALFSLLFWRKL